MIEYAGEILHAPMDRLDNILDYKVAEMNYLPKESHVWVSVHLTQVL